MIPTRWLVGLALVPLALGAAAVAVPQAILPMIAVDIAIALVAGLDWLGARGAITAEREVPTVQAVGRPADVTLSVQNTGSRALKLRVTDDAPGQASDLPASVELQPGARAEIPYSTVVDQRGQHAFGPVTARWRSPLGLWERQVAVAVEDVLRVYPDFAQLRSYGLQAKLPEQRAPVRVRRRAGGENEFQRLRPYVSGDPYRHIDWRATARHNQFISREFGQESNQNVIFLLDCGRMMSARSGSLTQFDHALNAALMMGQVALRHGDRVGLLAFDTQVRAWLPPKGGARTGGRLIRGTYDLFPTLDEPDYSLAFRYLGQRVKRRSLVVLLTAVVDQVNADLARSMLGVLGRRHLAMSVWLRDADVDEAVEGEGTDPWQRAAAAELTSWRERSLAEVRKRGALVVDCTPDQLTPALLGRYLEIKARRLL